VVRRPVARSLSILYTGCHEIRDLGIRRLMIPPAGFDEESVQRGLDDFAERVIGKLH